MFNRLSVCPLRFLLLLNLKYVHVTICMLVTACKPVISSSNTSNQEQIMCLLYWSMLSAGWNESSKNTLLDLVIGKYKDKKKNTELTEEANCSIHVHVH